MEGRLSGNQLDGASASMRCILALRRISGLKAEKRSLAVTGGYGSTGSFSSPLVGRRAMLVGIAYRSLTLAAGDWWAEGG
jgi:hypothetical protein